MIESGGVRAAQSLGVCVVGEAENRDLRIAVGDVGGVDPRDVRDHEIGRVDALGRLEAVLRQQGFELAADEEVDPTQQDRRHG